MEVLKFTKFPKVIICFSYCKLTFFYSDLKNIYYIRFGGARYKQVLLYWLFPNHTNVFRLLGISYQMHESNVHAVVK